MLFYMLKSFFKSLKKKKNTICILYWIYDNDANKYILDVNSCKCSNLFGTAYINNSKEYLFEFGDGAIGTIWATKQDEWIDVNNVSFNRFYRKDLAIKCKIKYINMVYLNSSKTIMEVASN